VTERALVAERALVTERALVAGRASGGQGAAGGEGRPGGGGVEIQLLPQGGHPVEAAGGAEVGEQVDGHAPPVQVEVGIEEVGLERGRTVGEGRSRSHVGHAAPASGRRVDRDGEHADGQRLAGVRADVGGREAERPPASVAVQHGSGHAVRGAEEALRGGDVPPLEGLADGARLGDDPVGELQCDHLEVGHRRAQQVEPARAVAAEAEVLADDDDRRPERAELGDEVLRRRRREGPVEGDDHDGVGAGLREEGVLLLLARQEAGSGEEHLGGGEEGDDDERGAERRRPGAGPPQQGTVADVHAVEVAEGDDGAGPLDLGEGAVQRDRCDRHHAPPPRTVRACRRPSRVTMLVASRPLAAAAQASSRSSQATSTPSSGSG
jgi:hypothetical protein